MIGSFCRLRISAVGTELAPSSQCQARSVSWTSAGRITSRFGIARSEARCSIGWCVGPSSPTPIESWVKTKIDGISISAAIRIAPRM